MKLQILTQRDEDGMYIASCPTIQGCHSQGDTYEEVLQNITEAVDPNREYLRDQTVSFEEIQCSPKFIDTEEIAVLA